MGLADIAEYARTLIWGVDWDKVAAQAGDMPPEELVLDPKGWAAYTEQLRVVYARANNVRDKIALAWDVPVEQVGPVVLAMEAGTIEKESAFWTMVNANYSFLRPEDAVEVDTEQFRILISDLWMNSLLISLGHQQAYYQLAEALTPEEIVESADQLHAFYQGIVYLWDKGYLDQLRKQNPATPPDAVPLSGLGAWQLSVGRAAGWVLLAALGILAFFLLYDRHSARQAEAVENCWKKAEKERDPERKKRLDEICGKAQEGLNDPNAFDPFGMRSAMNQFAVIAGVGLLVYGGIMLLPHLMRGFGGREARR